MKKKKVSHHTRGNLNDFLARPTTEKELDTAVIEPKSKVQVDLRQSVHFRNSFGDKSIDVLSHDVNHMLLQRACRKDFDAYWLSTTSFVKPSERVKSVPGMATDEPATDRWLSKSGSSVDKSTVAYEQSSDDISCLSGDDEGTSQFPVFIPLIVTHKQSYRARYNTAKSSINRGGALDSISLAGSESTPVFQSPSPRGAVLSETIVRNLVPILIRDLLAVGSTPKDGLMRSIEKGEISIADGKITAYNLLNKGLGDENGICFGKALPLTPTVTTINIAGNRLTDLSIRPILTAILGHLQCTSLNLSDNKLDDKSIEMLRANIQSGSCVLKELHLSKADIDDEECAQMIASLHTNTSLQSLVLSYNQIGGMEVIIIIFSKYLILICFNISCIRVTAQEYNTVFPDFTTGGEAIAEMLTINTTLLELDLSWNKIRKDTAMTLVRSVAVSRSLVKLNLSHNNIGDKAAQHLAHSLRQNVALTSLDVSFNQIYPKGVLVRKTG